jgi:hypothetical protein
MNNLLTDLIIGATIGSIHPLPIPDNSSIEPITANPGIYVSSKSTCLSAATFRNSHGNQSLFLGCTIPPFGASRFAVSFGRITGYPTHRYAIIPSVSISQDARIFVGLGEVPSVTLAIEWK